MRPAYDSGRAVSAIGQASAAARRAAPKAAEGPYEPRGRHHALGEREDRDEVRGVGDAEDGDGDGAVEGEQGLGPQQGRRGPRPGGQP
ncbi:hypothetical protein [Streptomyces sp. bgisy034]|uniref:hypothetical protein n=1 Tax=Streptomyces sp. bgisy034 TaxID=3413774 RepID=UPI003EB6D442